MKPVPVILCGGKGRRLDPIQPKQFQKLLGPRSMLQETALRAARVSKGGQLLAATLADYEAEVRTHLRDTDIGNFEILTESSPQGTAKAIHNAAIYAATHYGHDTILWILPADHYIGNEAALASAIATGAATALQGWIVTFGIKPTAPETGYGYIQTSHEMAGDGCRVLRFAEKPDYETAQTYIQNGYLWNSGMFMASAKTFLNAFENHHAEEGQSFDTAILEKSKNIAVVPCEMDWSDIGTPENLKRVQEKIRGKS